MKRKMVWVGTAWLAGLFMATTCRNSMTVWLLLAAWMLLGAFRLFRYLTTKQALCIGVSLTAAVGTVLAYTALVYRPAIAHDGAITTFSGSVTAVTVYDNDRASYQVKGSFADGASAKILVYTDDLGAQYGDVLHVAGSFSAPEDTYFWNEASYYRAKGIFLKADSDAYVFCEPTDGSGLICTLQQYRERISIRICTLAGTQAGGMVSAMLLGTKDTLDAETETAFLHNGISHVLSVSGLHLVLLLSVWLWLSKRCRLHRWAAFGGSVIWVVLYALLVGTPVSILRAGVMFLLVQSAPLLFRRADTWNSLCIAGILLTFPAPYLIQDASFLLSMTGTFGIGVFAPWMTKRMRQSGGISRLVRQFAVMVCVSVCTFPVTLLYFREVSIVSPVANIVLIPIASLMLLLALVIFLTGGVGWIAKPVCVVLHLLYDALMLLAHGLQRLVPVTFPVGWELLPLLAGVLMAFVLVVFAFRRKQRAVSLATVTAFVVLLAGQTVYRLGEQNCFQITVLGKSTQAVVVLSYQGRTDVIDLTGNHANPDYVEVYLEERGVRRLNSLCLTKRSAQMRMTYASVLQRVTAQEVVVASDCWMPELTTILGVVAQKADAFTLQDAAYAVTYEGGALQITFGTMQFYVGTTLGTLPAGNWDAIIGTAWRGTDDTMPKELYLKEEPIRLVVKANGSWRVEELG